jgi:hypothetical protein
MAEHFVEYLKLTVLAAAGDDLTRLRHEAADYRIEGNDSGKDDDGYLAFEPHLMLLNGLWQKYINPLENSGASNLATKSLTPFQCYYLSPICVMISPVAKDSKANAKAAKIIGPDSSPRF